MGLRLFGAMLIAAALAMNAGASAQSYPDRPVRILIAFPAGGTIDTLGRILAQKLGEAWGQNVVIENRPGGGGNIGAGVAAKSAPDGYTLHLGAQTLGVNVTLQPSKEFDPLKDFDPIMLVATAQDVLLVPPNSPFRSVQELIDYAKAHPGELNYASLGTGTSGHLATVLFSDLAGIKLQHVPYTTVSQAATDVMSGRIAVFLPTLGGHVGNVTAGRMHALAVSGTTRAAQLPDVPTFNELGVKFVDETSWYALFAPRGTPKEIITKVNADVERILAMPDVKEKGVTLGYRYVGGSPRQARRISQARDRQVGRGRRQRIVEMIREAAWCTGRLSPSFRDAAQRRARNPYSRLVVIDSGLQSNSPRLARRGCDHDLVGARLRDRVRDRLTRVFSRN